VIAAKRAQAIEAANAAFEFSTRNMDDHYFKDFEVAPETYSF